MKCLICNFKTSEIIDEKHQIYYKCNKCSYISKDKRYIVSKDEELRQYSLHNNSFTDIKYVNFFRRFIDLSIIPFIESGRYALDFGSGPSPVLKQVLEKYYRFNVDIYDLFYSKEKIYKGNSYDLVVSTEVVEHLYDPLKYFKLFKSLLKKDGIISIMTLFSPYDDEDFLNWWYRRDPTHISFYNINTMKYIGETLDLKLIYTDNIRYTSFRV